MSDDDTDTVRSPGELAYVEDRRRRLHYHDNTMRRTWRQLSDYARASWETNPTPRDWSERRKNDEVVTDGRYDN